MLPEDVEQNPCPYYNPRKDRYLYLPTDKRKCMWIEKGKFSYTIKKNGKKRTQSQTVYRLRATAHIPKNDPLGLSMLDENLVDAVGMYPEFWESSYYWDKGKQAINERQEFEAKQRIRDAAQQLQEFLSDDRDIKERKPEDQKFLYELAKVVHEHNIKITRKTYNVLLDRLDASVEEKENWNQKKNGATGIYTKFVQKRRNHVQNAIWEGPISCAVS